MRKLIMVLGLSAVALLLPTSMAFARAAHDVRHDGGYGFGGNNAGWSRDHGGDGEHHPFQCNGTYSGIAVHNLSVPASGVCLLTNSVIDGHVEVATGGDFEAGATSISGDIWADDAQTVYVFGGSTVGGSITTLGTAQTQIFGSTVNGRVMVWRGTDQVYLCGDTVNWGIAVRQSGPNILVGDYLYPDCPGNDVTQGNVVVADNATYVELVVSGNSVPNGSIFVTDNGGTSAGTSGESVQGNKGGDALVCEGNAAPFIGSPNPDWSQYVGQCSA